MTHAGFAAKPLALALLALALIALAPADAGAVPSYAEQTGQPCAACHVGAFGPRLRQLGRDFKLYGYVANDTKEHFPPISMMTQTSFTHTAAPNPVAPRRISGRTTISLSTRCRYSMPAPSSPRSSAPSRK
jgi:hypothetical protein